jgi:hypothetical protein
MGGRRDFSVKAHVSRLLAKLGAENRVQIALLVQDAATSRCHDPADHRAAGKHHAMAVTAPTCTGSPMLPGPRNIREHAATPPASSGRPA